MEIDETLNPYLSREEFIKKMIAPIGAVAIGRFVNIPLLRSAFEPVTDPTSIFDFVSSFRIQLRYFENLTDYKEYIDKTIHTRLENELGVELIQLSDIGNLYLHEVARYPSSQDVELEHGDSRSNGLIIATKLGYASVPSRKENKLYSDITSPLTSLTDEQLDRIKASQTVGYGLTFSNAQERVYMFELQAGSTRSSF